jgi:hypothetical protein
MFLTALNVLPGCSPPMSNSWKNEDDIKAELRVLTDELRTLRHELRNMVAPPKTRNPARAFLHRQAWPPTPLTAEDRPPVKREPPKKKS